MSFRTEVIADGVTCILGDCREVLPSLGKVAVVVTDPVWPNAPPDSIPGSDRPEELFAEAAPYMALADRVVVQIGCDSDPRMLSNLNLPFLRVCWLEYACPTYKGRLLHTGDVAYCYGTWPAPRPGATVMPGKCVSGRLDKEFVRGPRVVGKEKGRFEALDHPMPRRLEFVRWIVRWWSCAGETILDPFMGSGTTAVAAIGFGREFIGIEKEPKYFDFACRRISDALLQPNLFVERPKPPKAERLI